MGSWGGIGEELLKNKNHQRWSVFRFLEGIEQNKSAQGYYGDRKWMSGSHLGQQSVTC